MPDWAWPVLQIAAGMMVAFVIGWSWRDRS